MIKNPPLYEVPGPDGLITQKWRGMPKLPDLIETMLDLRKERSRKARIEQEGVEGEKWKAMERDREEHPEKYLSIAQAWKQLKRDVPQAFANSTRKAPEVRMESTGRLDKYGLEEKIEAGLSDVQYQDRLQMLEQQKKKLLNS